MYVCLFSTLDVHYVELVSHQLDTSRRPCRLAAPATSPLISVCVVQIGFDGCLLVPEFCRKQQQMQIAYSSLSLNVSEVFEESRLLLISLSAAYTIVTLSPS